MSMIYVRTKPDRRAYFEGRIIPSDKFIPVTDTPYVRRLVHVWEDLEVEGGREEKPQQQAPARTRPQAPEQVQRHNQEARTRVPGVDVGVTAAKKD